MSSCISILGSTGSIGRQTLDVVDKLGLRVAALTANRDVDRLEAQCRKYRPKLAVMMDEAAYKELKARLSDMNITVVLGLEGLITAASLPEADTVVTAWSASSQRSLPSGRKNASRLPTRKLWFVRASS